MTAFPNKAISAARDRLQSRILVCIAPILAVLVIQAVRFSLMQDLSWRVWMLKVAAISLTFGIAAFALRAATRGAAACGSIICLLLTFYTGPVSGSPFHSALSPLFALFLLTFAATRAGRGRKAERGLAEGRKGRQASQVVANLGLAALLSCPIGYAQSSDFEPHRTLFIAILAALAEATADTVSSEIGQAFGGTPFLLTTLRRVPPGTDGAITLLGTIAGITAAALIVIIGLPAMGMSGAECAVALGAGVTGLFFDSLLGATIERRGWLGNDLVNFVSTAFAALLGLVAARFV